MDKLEVLLLGPPRAEVDGRVVEVDTRKATALLAYLSLTGRRHSRASLAALLWPDQDQVHARGALRRTLSVLNKSLGGRWLAADRSSIGLHRSGLEVDVGRFRALVSLARSHSHDESSACADCSRALGEAAELYRGDLLSGFALRDSPEFDDWQTFEAEGLRRELGGALESLVRLERNRGDLGAAIRQARRWLSLDEMQESAHGELMRLYALDGQRAAAIRQYRDCVVVLERELGVPPLGETTRLYEAIRRDGLPRAGPATVSASSREPPRPASYPLVGRAAELEQLARALRSVGPDGLVVLLEGEAGIGKTRLGHTFLQRAALEGSSTVTLRCFEHEATLPYAPIADGLRALIAAGGEGVSRLVELDDRSLAEAARLTSDLLRIRPGLPEAPPLDGPGAQGRFFEGLTRVLSAACAGARPGVLFVDDLHWADDATLEVLSYMARRLRERPLLILLARREQPDLQERLRPLLAALRPQDAAVTIAPQRLSPGEVDELVTAAGERSGAGGLSRRLYEETEGVPFFVVEYLESLASLSREDESWPLPSGARALLQGRIEPTSQTARQVLSAAAVIGRSFDFEIVRQASGRSDEEVISSLEELAARGLVAEVEGPGSGGALYDFAHERVRGLVFEETSLARRRLLHGRVGEALARRARNHAENAGVVASHLRAAGREEEAAALFKVAGEHARSLYANAQALAYLREAAALGHPELAELHEAMGDLQVLEGAYEDALESFERAVALGGPEARLEHRLGDVYQRRGEWELADAHFGAALASVTDKAARARIVADRSLNEHRRGSSERAQQLAQEALDLAEIAGDDEALAQAHNLLGVLASARDDGAEAVRHLRRSLELAESLDDDGARIAALNNLALTARRSEELDEAMALNERALELCATRGDRHREAALHNNMADLLHACGRAEEAMAHLKRAVAIFADIGSAGELQPEIWKLVEW